MRSFTMFLLGVIAGAAAYAAVQRLQEHVGSEDHESLADRMQLKLSELEERLPNEFESA
jgi:hypothetical protein